VAGIVGWKAKQAAGADRRCLPRCRLPLDSIGPMAKKRRRLCVGRCGDGAGDKPVRGRTPRPLSGLRFGIWQGVPFDGADSTVAGGVVRGDRPVSGKAGVRLSDETIALIDDMGAGQCQRRFLPPTEIVCHPSRAAEARRAAGIDTLIRARIERGRHDFRPTTIIDMTAGAPGVWSRRWTRASKASTR